MANGDRFRSYLSKRYLRRQSETRTKHLLRRCHISHIKDLHFRRIHRDLMSDLLRYLLADLLLLNSIIMTLRREAVHMDHGQLCVCVRLEQVFMATIDALESREKGDSCGGGGAGAGDERSSNKYRPSGRLLRGSGGERARSG